MIANAVYIVIIAVIILVTVAVIGYFWYIKVKTVKKQEHVTSTLDSNFTE